MKKSLVFLLTIALSLPLFPQNEAAGPSMLEGFAETPWGTSFEGVRERFISMAQNPDSDEQIAIINEKKDEFILIRRNGIFYHYRFYKTPEEVVKSRPKTEEMAPSEHEGQGALFSVGVIFSYIKAKMIQEKLEAKYGKPLKESLDDKKIAGARLWELATTNQEPPKGGFILQWQENYQQAPFTRRIDYFGAELQNIIKKEYRLYYDARELKILKDMVN